jgi:sugar transferase (PEP-CTERM/EpsH1 system associated)
MHMAELDSDKWRQYAETRSFPSSWVYRREHRALLDFERELSAAVDLNVFCTPLEERIFQEQIPGPPSAVLPNGVELSRFTPAPEEAEPGHVVFCGVMDYFPNVDACARYARHVLPKLRREVPGATFTIVGSHPTPEVQALADLPGVSVTGFVPDTRDSLRRASLSVAPMRIARGIQNKVLEAMSMGLPVVASPCAVQGVGARPGIEYLVADTDDELLAASIQVLRDPARARELGSAGRRWVEEHCDWERVLDRLPALLDRARETFRRKQR